MKDRIRQIMESQHMTQQVFADFIGTTPATLSGIFNDRTRPTLSIIELIKKKIPDISTDWLMFGTGQMYQQSSAADSVAPSSGTAAAAGGQVSEAVLDFGSDGSPTPRHVSSALPFHNGVRNTLSQNVREEMKILDKPVRRVVEIRIYYDDQTWESFTPSKK